MSRLSRPILIAMVSVLAVAGVWFLLLRPKPVNTEVTQTPAAPEVLTPPASSSAPSGASGASTKQSADAQIKATPLPSSKAATERPAVAIDPRAPAGERAVLTAMNEGKVVVLLFWNPEGTVDRAASSVITRAVQGRKKVYVRRINAKDVARYEAITGSLTVSQTPTTMVIGPKGKAVSMTGLTDTLQVSQAIVRARP